MTERNDLKGRRGLERLWNATRYSLGGYRAAWQGKKAFRQIVLPAGLSAGAYAGLTNGISERKGCVAHRYISS